MVIDIPKAKTWNNINELNCVRIVNITSNESCYLAYYIEIVIAILFPWYWKPIALGMYYFMLQYNYMNHIVSILLKRLHNDVILRIWCKYKCKWRNFELTAPIINCVCAGFPTTNRLILHICDIITHVKRNITSRQFTYNRCKINTHLCDVMNNAPVWRQYESFAAFAYFHQRVPEMTSSHRIHPGRWFVEKDDLRVTDERHGCTQFSFVSSAVNHTVTLLSTYWHVYHVGSFRI